MKLKGIHKTTKSITNKIFHNDPESFVGHLQSTKVEISEITVSYQWS